MPKQRNSPIPRLVQPTNPPREILGDGSTMPLSGWHDPWVGDFPKKQVSSTSKKVPRKKMITIKGKKYRLKDGTLDYYEE